MDSQIENSSANQVGVTRRASSNAPGIFHFDIPHSFFFLLKYAKEEEYFPRGHINLHATRESRSSSGYSNGVTISFLYRVTKRFRGQSANIPRLFYRRV